MLRLINDTTNTYRLTIEYQEREYNYIARPISRLAGEELWFVWAIRNGIPVILQFKFNTATKELTENLQHGQRSFLPEDFLNAIKQSFAQKK